MLTPGMERSLCGVQTIISPSGDPQVENHCFNASRTGLAALLVLGLGFPSGVSSAASRKKTGSLRLPAAPQLGAGLHATSLLHAAVLAGLNSQISLMLPFM